MEELIFSEFGDLWFVVGINGEMIPLYSDWNCERAAVAAFLAGDYGSLTTEEIQFFRESLRTR